MSKRVLAAMVIGLCIAVVIGGILGGMYCFGRGNNHGLNGNAMDTFGRYSGLCLDAAIIGSLAAIAFALRKRPGWPSASGLFLGGGLLMLIVVGPTPGFLLLGTLSNDLQSFFGMLVSGCILLTMAGAAMVVHAINRAREDNVGEQNGSPDSMKLCRNCGSHVVGNAKTCKDCGADLK